MKILSFEKVNKIIDKDFSTKKKGEDTIRNEKGGDTIDKTEIQRMIRQYFNQLYANIYTSHKY